MQLTLWIAALVTPLVGLPALGYWLLRRHKPASHAPLPSHWAVSARPVFNTKERHLYRLLRQALPNHVVLSKLPLVRFCQPTDSSRVRYWYELLGSNNVAFAICSASGRVIAAIDFDTPLGQAQRPMEIKQAVLRACRIRYLRCPVDSLPTIAKLQSLVPQADNAASKPQLAPEVTPTLHSARDTLASTVAHRRAERAAGWSDSTFSQDSFFGSDSRMHGLNSEFGDMVQITGTHETPSVPGSTVTSSDIAGIVVDTPSPRFAPTQR